jgi:hypothetical protein
MEQELADRQDAEATARTLEDVLGAQAGPVELRP